jgi:hypothetical protein
MAIGPWPITESFVQKWALLKSKENVQIGA